MKNINFERGWNLSKAAPTFDTTFKNFTSNRIININDRSVISIGSLLKMTNLGTMNVPLDNAGITREFNSYGLPTFENIYNVIPSSGYHDPWSGANIIHDLYQSNQLVPLSGLNYLGTTNGFDYIYLNVTTNLPIVIDFCIYNGHTEMEFANAFLIESTDIISIPVYYGLFPYISGDYFGLQCMMTICYIGNLATLSKAPARINSDLSGVTGFYEMNPVYTFNDDEMTCMGLTHRGYFGISNTESVLEMGIHGHYNCQWNISESFTQDQYLSRTEKYLNIRFEDLLPEL